MLCTIEWENLYDKHALQALSSSTLDRCPILVSSFPPPRSRPKFRFESFWVNMQDFKDVVSEAWNRDTPNHLNHMLTLHVKLGRTAKALKSWSESLVSHARVAMAICRDVILQLEVAQESRSLSAGELDLVKVLKLRILGLTAMEKSRAR
jgi:hypothetical protein